ncbi:hypothetical protein [Nocardia aurantiaca]|uniref:Uncharacterized protein n=1 Tax=Nocardia aurantiaca TaxID=2675850 RepID=A0A6I3L2B4_9NOCA|nr:hypothetical protein [Nocardia aurantiaca]MTE15428.1 hypothetical protein [Nocardia aurantiaca]
MIRLPDWVEVGAPVRFRMTGRDDVECTISAITPAGRVTLCNGECFDPTDLMPGSHDATRYFEKFNRLSGMVKSVRKA